jgi:hypothetical protein
MANHAKVITGKTLDPEDVNKIVQRLNEEKLGGVFTITYEKNVPSGWGKHQWFLQYKNKPFLTMVFWLSDDVDYINFEKPKVISEQSCIEFRHGHSFQFMWWVEGVFRENLGKHYNANMWDDGIGECGPANPEHFETFKTYAIGNKNYSENEIKKWKEVNFDWQKEKIPEELIKALDLDFDTN